MNKPFIIVLFIFSSVFFSCISHQTPPAPSYPFFGTRWQLVELNQEPITPWGSIKIPFVEFSKADHKITGNTGCNSFFGSFRSTDAPFDFGPLGMTRMACQGWTDNEINFLNVLEHATAYEIVQNMLLIRKDDKISARLKALAP